MAFQLDFADDMDVLDNTLIVDLKNPDEEEIFGLTVLRRQVERTTVEQGSGTVFQLNARFHMKKKDIEEYGTIPKRDGYLTDPDENRWYINDVSLVTMDTRYQIETTLQSGSDLVGRSQI